VDSQEIVIEEVGVVEVVTEVVIVVDMEVIVVTEGTTVAEEVAEEGLVVEAVIEDEDVDLRHTALCLEVGPALKVLLVEDVVEEEDQDLAPDPNKVINIKQNMDGPLRRFQTTRKIVFESHASNATYSHLMDI